MEEKLLLLKASLKVVYLFGVKGVEGRSGVVVYEDEPRYPRISLSERLESIPQVWTFKMGLTLLVDFY